ncbi:MAG: hypothetical protein Kow0077_16340 [Anaerolineae bacterium]
MARKKRKQANISQEALERARREASGEVYAPPQPTNQPQTSAQALSSAVARTTYEDLAKEYGYVAIDLRNMGILAAILFALLVILSFIL